MNWPIMVALVVKNPPASAGDIRDSGFDPWLRSLGQEDALEKGMATHSSILAWRIPGTEEPDRLHSIGSHSWTGLKWLSMHAWEKKMATHSSILAWRIPGTEEPGGLPSTGSKSQTWLKRLSSSSSSLMGANCAGSLKLTRVGAFTPQKTAHTTNHHYFS